MKIFLVKIIYICSSKNFGDAPDTPRPKFLSRNFCKNAFWGLISVLLRSLLAADLNGVRTVAWVGQNFLNTLSKHPRAVYSMCGHQALGHGPQNEGRNFCRYCLWGYLSPDMTKIWFFDNPSKWPEKASLCIKYPRIHPKRAWGEYLHPAGTLWAFERNPKIFMIFVIWPATKIF